MPTWLFNAFFIRMNPWKFGEYQFKIDKVIQHLLKVTPQKEYKKYRTRAIKSRAGYSGARTVHDFQI